MNQELARLNRQVMLIAKLHENESRLTQYLEATPLCVYLMRTGNLSTLIRRRRRYLVKELCRH